MPEVKLRPLALSDLTQVLKWSRDEEFCLANGWPLGLPQERLQEWFLRFLNNPPVDLYRQGILLGEKLVGYVDLKELNPLERRARLGIAIGNSAYRGRGIGYASGLQMLRHGFEELGLERITAEIHASNPRMIALAERLGFTREGILRQHETRRGAKEDLHLFGMLREEFIPRSVLSLAHPGL